MSHETPVEGPAGSRRRARPHSQHDVLGLLRGMRRLPARPRRVAGRLLATLPLMPTIGLVARWLAIARSTGYLVVDRRRDATRSARLSALRGDRRTRLAMARILEAAGAYREALEAVSGEPPREDDARRRWASVRARATVRLGRYAEAAAVLEDASRSWPGDGELARVASRLGRTTARFTEPAAIVSWPAPPMDPVPGRIAHVVEHSPWERQSGYTIRT